MKLDKKKITFAVVIVTVVIFIITYSFLTFGADSSVDDTLQQTQVPALEIPKDNYTSRLEAVDAIKEARETNIPSIYDERYLDSTGVFDPNFLDSEKARMVDSIYKNSRIDYSSSRFKDSRTTTKNAVGSIAGKAKGEQKNKALDKEDIDPKTMALEQQLFFASNPLPNTTDAAVTSIPVVVDRKQTIKANDRLEMRTISDAVFHGIPIPKNTVLFGIASFKPNRVLLDIENIDGIPLSFKAFDLRDKLEGIYIRNTFREDLRQEVMREVVEDINVPGMPQVTGIKRVFQRSNRQVKVSVNSNYKLILKVYSQP